METPTNKVVKMPEAVVTTETTEKPVSNLETVKQINKVEITLGGKVYNLIYDMNAFAELEQEYGTVDTAIQAISNAPKIKDIKFFLWAGLLHDTAVVDEDGDFIKHGITVYKVGSMLRPSDLQTISAGIFEAVSRDLRTDTVKDASGKNA